MLKLNYFQVVSSSDRYFDTLYQEVEGKGKDLIDRKRALFEQRRNKKGREEIRKEKK